jgi:two-component system NtrC family response regulator
MPNCRTVELPNALDKSKVCIMNSRTAEPPNTVEHSRLPGMNDQTADPTNSRTALRGGASSLRVGDSSGSETGAAPELPNVVEPSRASVKNNRTTEPSNDRTVLSDRQPVGRVLIVDDEDGIRTQLRWGLSDRFQVVAAATADEARQAVQKERFDAVTLDLGLPPDPTGPSEGLRLLEEFLAHDPAMKVMVLTGNADRENAIRAVQLGAFDYYLKPVDLAEVSAILQRACRLSRLDRESLDIPAPTPLGPPSADIIGESAVMRRIFDTIRRVARTDVTVLISGESGTGKELVARAIHASSPRRKRAFVAINCGAIPENLVESELFGHEKGSFTGAHAQRKGRLETGDGGTVFLDEVAELSGPIQVKLLRILQDRQLERVGGRELIPLDVRILAATNRDIKRATHEGRFREDLYYRLAVVNIEIPPLRERVEDIRALAMRLLERFSAEYKVRVRKFAPDALAAMHAYPWPGNVRELENRIKRAVIMADGRNILATDLELAGEAGQQPTVSLKAARNEVERRILVEALQRHQGNISRAAKAVQLSRPAFHELLSKHSIRADEFKRQAHGA